MAVKGQKSATSRSNPTAIEWETTSPPNGLLEGIPERIRRAADLAGGPNELAAKTGIKRRTLGDYLAGSTEPKASAIVAISGATDLSADWLLTGIGPERLVDRKVNGLAEGGATYIAAAEGTFIFLPPHQTPIGDGDGVTIRSDQIVNFLAFDGDWIRSILRHSPSSFILVEARGDSMSPTITDGDILIVDTAAPALHGDAVYVYATEGADGIIIRRFQRKHDGRIVIIADNDRYPHEELSPAAANELRIIGEVVWRGARL